MATVAPVELLETDLDLTPWIHAGMGVAWAQACAEPVVLVDALLRHAAQLRPLRVFAGLSWRDLTGRIGPGVEVTSYGALGQLGRLPSLTVVPCHMSALPDLFAAGSLPGDVVLVQTAPPDAHGRCSLGVGADYIADAAVHARVVIAEVNDRCPSTSGTWIPWDRLSAVVRTSRALLEAPVSRPGAVETAIAARVAALVESGDTIQVGVGALPEAILGQLGDHRRLGIHSGMVSDGVLDLIESGAVTNEGKGIDRGLSITGAALGSARLFAALRAHPDIVFRPVSYTHAAATLAKVGPLCAINSAVEIDLRGQVNSEEVSGRRIGAVGGQVDFLRGASLSGGKPIVALPAARIVRQLTGPVSASRSDVDWVVTEHGARSLRGLSEAARAAALMDLAGPGRTEELRG